MQDSESLVGELRVLVTSVEPKCLKSVRASLAKEPRLKCRIVECDRFDAARTHVAHHPFDLIVLDTCIEDLRWLSENANGAALVFLARGPSAPTTEQALAAGAIDSFAENEIAGSTENLWLALRQSIRYHALNRRLAHLTDLVRKRSTQVVQMTQWLMASPFDYRTGWHSQRHIFDRTAEELHRAERYASDLTLVLVHLDGLSAVQEAHGDDAVGGAFTELAERMRTVARPSDLVGHYGADGILVVLTGTGESGGERFCERVAQTLEKPVLVGDITVEPKCTFAMIEYHRGDENKPGVSDLLALLHDRVTEDRDDDAATD